jgi:hypothetical protein
MLSIKNGYRNIFEYANIPMWEQDISKALPFLSLLKKQGIKDVALFIQKNPEIALLMLLMLIKQH